MARILLATLLLWPGAVAAQSLTGTYVFQSPNGAVTLTLQQQGAAVTGSMVGADGAVFTLQGAVEDGRATGSIRIGDGTGWFVAGFVDGELKMIVAEVDPATGQPDLDSGWALDFTRAAGPVAGAKPRGEQGTTPGGGPATGPGGAQPQAAASPIVREWLGHLSGRKLSFRESYSSSDVRGTGGFSNRWDAWLCSDGTFFFQSSSTVSADVGAVTGLGRGGNVTRGTWRVVEQGGQVVLQYQMEGSAPEYGVLTYQGGATYLDRNRIYVTHDNPHCP